MLDLNITITRPYRASIAEVPAEVIVASLPQIAEPLVRNTYLMALLLGKLRHAAKRLRFVEGKLTLGGYRLTITPKGPLVHLIDMGVKPHSLAPLKPLPGSMRTTYPWHPGFPGRHFMPAALKASLPEMQHILDRNTAIYLEKQEVK